MEIDLNADIGEGYGRWTLGDDESLLAIITSANIACGFHAGDPQIMRRVCEQAVAKGVAIGAQVGYRDLAGFGRRKVEVSGEDLTSDVLYQLGALQAFAQAAGDRVRYLKPHGALYNTAITDQAHARALLDAILAFDPSLPILTLAGSMLARVAAEAGVRVVPEAFADRAYLADGTLMPRGLPGAVLHDPAVIADRASTMVRDGSVITDGGRVAVTVRSVCVHGDTPAAVEIARAVRESLLSSGASLERFA